MGRCIIYSQGIKYRSHSTRVVLCTIVDRLVYVYSKLVFRSLLFAMCTRRVMINAYMFLA